MIKLAKPLPRRTAGGVIHRDLKPANIMVDANGEPIIMDFGLARLIHKKEDSGLTQSGLVMGSPTYMSPEQVEGDGRKIGTPSDIYSLGVIFYELLRGAGPDSKVDRLGVGTDRHRDPKSVLRAQTGRRSGTRGDLPQDDRQASGGSLFLPERVAAALESYTAGRPTGVWLSRMERNTSEFPGGANSSGLRSRRHSFAVDVGNRVVATRRRIRSDLELLSRSSKAKGDEEIKSPPPSQKRFEAGEAKVCSTGRS